MDSLIVLRKPLRKARVGLKYGVGQKLRKPASKAEPIPTEPGLASDPLYSPAVSFVRLWRSLCRAAPAPARHNSPDTAAPAALPPPARPPRAELVMELAYPPYY